MTNENPPHALALAAEVEALKKALMHIMAIASYTPMQTELTTAGEMGRIMRVAENALNGKDFYDRPAAQDRNRPRPGR
jgi:hypothetical protein